MSRPGSSAVLLGSLCLTLALASCSNRAIYESVQRNRLQGCEAIPIPQQKACRAQYQMSYDEYKSHRDALIAEESNRS